MPGSEQVWDAPPDNLALLESGEVHVWQAPLEQPEAVLLSLKQMLSHDELDRARKFHFERDRHHFIVARGVLRTLLGRYLHRPPAQLQFSYNAQGKPLLDMPVLREPLHFNLSHAHELALFAFSYVGPLGVDIEYMRSGVSAEQAARVSFSPREQALLLALPLTERREAFYSCWTRKEAYIKGRGTGFSLEPHLFDVAFLPGLVEARELVEEARKPEAPIWRFGRYRCRAGRRQVARQTVDYPVIDPV